MDLEINITSPYVEEWKMKVFLKPFLLDEGRQITKVSKLIRLIKHSCQPDQINIIREFIDNFDQSYKPSLEELKKRILELDAKVKKENQELQRTRHMRNSLRKFLTFGQVNPEWDKCNVRVQYLKDQLKWDTAAKREVDSAMKKLLRDRVFLDKVIKLLK